MRRGGAKKPKGIGPGAFVFTETGWTIEAYRLRTSQMALALPPRLTHGTDSVVPCALISRSLAATAALFVGAAAVSLGCSGGGSSPPGSTGNVGTGESGADAGGTVGCTGQGDTYKANLTKTGTKGYTFTLVQASPAPPAQYANVWTLKVTDASGGSPSASQVALDPFMPLMGHGSDQVPSIAANADGTFTVTDVYLFMQGLWTVTVKVTQPADGGAEAPLDSAVFEFCID